MLHPNLLYLGRTVERTETRNLVPMIEGRSSIGRLGLFVHVTAGFGDVGFCGYWTLEMFAVQPVRIYAGVAICQIFYHDIRGSFTEYASNKYQHNTDIQPSLLFKELTPRPRPTTRNGSSPSASSAPADKRERGMAPSPQSASPAETVCGDGACPLSRAE